MLYSVLRKPGWRIAAIILINVSRTRYYLCISKSQENGESHAWLARSATTCRHARRINYLFIVVLYLPAIQSPALSREAAGFACKTGGPDNRASEREKERKRSIIRFELWPHSSLWRFGLGWPLYLPAARGPVFAKTIQPFRERVQWTYLLCVRVYSPENWFYRCNGQVERHFLVSTDRTVADRTGERCHSQADCANLRGKRTSALEIERWTTRAASDISDKS